MILLILALAVVDYRDDATWLCRPGRQDACSADIATTIVSSGGRMRAAATPNNRPRDVDCFYVYPTVSLDPGGNSDMHADAQERDMTQAHLAAFRGVCRTFAPLYRQVTLTALRKALGGGAIPGDVALAYGDVRAAWRHYLAHDNNGRPFVLIGHSQGSAMLQRLIANEVDGKPVQRRMLSAILPGRAILVPVGKDVGGDFKGVPLCRTATQTGCVVTWASYRDTATVPANALFGRSSDPTMVAGCTHPARLGGGRAALAARLGSPWWKGGIAQYAPPKTGWSVAGRGVPTRYVAMPGLLSGRCVQRDGARYLAVRVSPGKAEPLAETVVGTSAIGDDLYPDWGFHVADIEIVQGDLIHMVERQRTAYLSRRRQGR